MKKMLKGIAILAATAAVGTGVAFASGCSTGFDGEYIGVYHYPNAWNPNATYGIKVKVYVENNIITKVEDITKVDEESKDWTSVSAANDNAGWTDASVKNWTDNEEWLLQQYEGMTVSDVLAIQGYVMTTGQPYNEDKNSELVASGLVISGATQGSGRLLLAVQNALGKTTEYGRVQKPQS